MHLPLKNLSIGVAALALFTGLPEAWQQKAPPPSSERAQEQPFPAGSPFALLPGFKIERVTPADKTESYIVVTFDPQGRPVVSQSSSGAGSSPRVLLDENKDGIYEGEKIVAEMLNTCHGLFYANRTTLYGDCRGEVPGDPPPPAEPQFGRGQQGRGARARRTGRTRRTRRGATGRRRRPWTESAPGARRPRLLQAGGHQRRRRDGSDRADQRLRGGGHGRPRPARDSPRPRRLDHVPDRQQHLRRLAPRRWPGQRCGGRYRGVAELEQRRGAPVPAAVQRSALRQQHPHRRARHGVAAAAEQQVQPVLQRDAQSLRLRLQPGRRGVHLRQRHGVGRQRAVVSRGAHGSHDPRRRRRLSQRHRQVPGRVLRHDSGAAAPAPRLAGRRRVLSELRLSREILRQPVRGRLVAGTAALHGADPERRDLHGPRGPRGIRPRRADADHRSRGRSGRQHLPDHRRRGRAGRALQGVLDRREAGATGHDRHSRGRAAAAAALELGVGCHREGESLDGRVVRRRAREAGAQQPPRRRAIARARCSKCSATAPRRTPRCSRRC